MDRNLALLRALADGRFHSGPALAADLGLSRAAVSRRIAGLVRRGLPVHAARGRGYRLASGLDLLDADAIRTDLGSAENVHLDAIEVLFQIDSTNQYLLERPRPHACAVLAEYQTLGRGRRGRQWMSPPASGICLSLGWHFAAPPATLVLLSLLTGACAARALAACGVQGIGLKWPNDLVHGDRKLGGILIESRAQAAGPMDVVIGIGINVRLPESSRAAIAQPVTDLAALCNPVPARNRVAAAVLAELLRMLADPSAWPAGLAEWRARDSLRGRSARLELPGRALQGVVEGIDDAGQLLLRVDGTLQRFGSGDLSLRADA